MPPPTRSTAPANHPIPLRFTERELEIIDSQRGEQSRSAWVRGLVNAAIAKVDSPDEWLPPLVPLPPLADLGPLEDDAPSHPPPMPPKASASARRLVAAIAALAAAGDDGARAKLLQDIKLAAEEALRDR